MTRRMPPPAPAAWAAQPQCQACTLAATRTATVSPSGPPGARLVLVSDIPEPADARTGRRFSSPGSRRLAKLLAARGIDLAQCGLASCCACPAPDHRRPRAPEVRACAPWLEKALRTYFQPTVILAVGGIATRYFYGPGRFLPLLVAAHAAQHVPPDPTRAGVRVVPVPSLGTIRQRAANGLTWHAVAEQQLACAAGYLSTLDALQSVPPPCSTT